MANLRPPKRPGNPKRPASVKKVGGERIYKAEPGKEPTPPRVPSIASDEILGKTKRWMEQIGDLVLPPVVKDLAKLLFPVVETIVKIVAPVVDAVIQEVIDTFYVPPPPLPPLGPDIPPEFDKYPTRAMADSFRAQESGSTVEENKHLCWLQRRRYVDHRQQYEAVAVCNGNHPRNHYLTSEGGKDFFSYYLFNRDLFRWELRLCEVTPPPAEFWKNWDWGGAPPDYSDLTAGAYMITWATWASYFLGNGIPTVGDWEGLSCSGFEIPCELGDHVAEGQPYGPDGCLRVPLSGEGTLGELLADISRALLLGFVQLHFYFRVVYAEYSPWSPIEKVWSSELGRFVWPYPATFLGAPHYVADNSAGYTIISHLLHTQAELNAVVEAFNVPHVFDPDGWPLPSGYVYGTCYFPGAETFWPYASHLDYPVAWSWSRV